MPNSNLRRMMMAQKQAGPPPEDWDYEWSWESGIMPPNATYSKATPVADGVQFEDFKLVFPDIAKTGNASIFMKARIQGTSSPFAMMIRYEPKTGAKTYFGASGDNSLQTNIVRSEIEKIPMRNMTEVEMRYNAGVFELYADKKLIVTGPGVQNNNYLLWTGFDARNHVPYVLAELKWRSK